MTDNYVASTIEISINQFFEKYIESKTVTFYKLEIYDNYSKERWELDKRYSEIDYLHKTLFFSFSTSILIASLIILSFLLQEVQKMQNLSNLSKSLKVAKRRKSDYEKNWFN